MISLYLAQPWWSLLLILPLVLLWLKHSYERRQAQRYCSVHLMSFMKLTQHSVQALPWRWLAVWMLLVLVLCQPKWIDANSQSQQRPIQWVAVVDLSDSMQAQDVQPNRLQQARWLLEQSVNQWQEGDRAGLIVFTASHHWLMPLTADKNLWQAKLSLLEQNLLPLRGSLLHRTMIALDGELPADVAMLVVTDGGEIDVTSLSAKLSRGALMVVLGKGSAVLPASVRDGVGVDVGVPFTKLKRFAHELGIDWITGDQAATSIASWLDAQREHATVLENHQSKNDIDLREGVLILTLLVWLSFWRFSRFFSSRLSTWLLPLLLLSLFSLHSPNGWAVEQVSFEVAYQQAQAATESKAFSAASRLFQQAFRLALTDKEQSQALQGLASSLQAQADWFSAAQSWRGLLAYQPENTEAKAQLTVALSHLPKSVDWSGEGGKRPKGSREGTIDDWPDMPEQEEIQDVLNEVRVKNSLEISPLIIQRRNAEPTAVSQLAQQQKQARSDTTFLGEARTLGAQQRGFYQRLFEQEAGFAAAQTEPQIKEGVLPW